jgi:hypothetical protein
MFRILWLLVTTIFRCLHARRTLLLENLVLRQQLAVLKRKHPRPRLRAFDKIFWVLACRFWFGWKQALIVVSPEIVVGWHRAGFKLYWRATSRARRVIGRKRISKEVRILIFRMVAENATWGAPRIHGELLMLGFDVSERTISFRVQAAERIETRPGAAKSEHPTDQVLLMSLNPMIRVPVYDRLQFAVPRFDRKGVTESSETDLPDWGPHG